MGRPLSRPPIGTGCLLVTISLLVAVVAPTVAGTPSFDGTLRIGLPMTITGGFAPQAVSQNESWSMWRDLVNTAGGVHFDSKRYKVELISRDIQTSYALAGQYAEELITKENCTLLFAPYSSTLTPAVAEVGERFKVPVVAGQAAAAEVYMNSTTGRRRFQYLVGVNTPASQYFADFVDLMAIKQAKTIAIITEDATFPQAAAEGARLNAADQRMTVVADITVPRVKELTDSDKAALTAALEQVAAANPDVLVGAVYFTACTYLVQEAKRLNYFPKAWAMSICVGSPNLLAQLGDDVAYLFGPSQWDWRLRGRQYSETDATATTKHFGLDGTMTAPEQFCADYTNRYGHNPSYQAAGSMAMGYVVESGLKLAQGTDSLSIMRSMNALYDPSFYGRLAFSFAGVDVFRSMVTYQYQNRVGAKGCTGELLPDGESIETVTPLSAATAEVVYPAPQWSERVYTRTLFDKPEEQVVVSITIVCMAGTVALSFIFFGFRRTKIVAASNHVFCQLMFLASLIVYSAVLAWPADADEATCKGMPMLFVNGLMLFAACLLAKNYRVCKIVSNKRLQRVKVRSKHLISMVAGLVAVQLLLCVLWYILGAPSLHLVVQDVHRPSLNFHDCLITTDESQPVVVIIGAVSAIVGLATCVVAFMARRAPSAYNESRHIALAAYNIFLGGLLFLGLQASPVAKQASLRSTWYLLRCGLFLVVVTGTLVAVFGPKLMWLWHERHGVDIEREDARRASGAGGGGRGGKHTGVARGRARGKKKNGGRAPTRAARASSMLTPGSRGTASPTSSRSGSTRGHDRV